MIALLAFMALLQVPPHTVMSPGANDDRMTAEAFRANAETAATLLAETAVEDAIELPVTGGAVQMTRGFDAAGRAALLFTPVPGSGARRGEACRVTEIRPDGQDNTARAIQWCRNVLGTGMIAVQR
jgi:hypothetical protein